MNDVFSRPPLDVEISLVNTNNRDLLEKCLASLQFACASLRWHVTLVDNASTDRSAEMVADTFPDVGIHRNTQRLGFSANHNIVLRDAVAAGSRYALVLNEDVEMDAEAVTKMVAHADRHPEIGMVGPLIRGTDGSPQPSFFAYPRAAAQPWLTLVSRPPSQRERSSGWLNGSCLLIRTAALAQVGLLDERYFIFFEDTDLSLRLERAGWRIDLCRAAGIVHHGHQTITQPEMGSRFELQFFRSRYLYFCKHHGRIVAAFVGWSVRMALLIRAVKALSQGAISRDPAERHHGRNLLRIAAYDPTSLLPHEEPQPAA